MLKGVPGCIEGIRGIMGCSGGVSGVFRGVLVCSGDVPGMFQGVPEGVPGFYRHQILAIYELCATRAG